MLRQEIATQLNSCISARGIKNENPILPQEIIITDKTITTSEAFRGDVKGIANMLFTNFVPQSPDGEYHHFTKFSAFEQIVQTEQIQMSAVEKRFRQHEFRPFYEDHEMDGYRLRLADGIPMEQQFVKDVFFWSLTSSYLDTKEELELWDEFAGSKGVRLAFSISNVRTDFRKIYYSGMGKGIPVLKDLMTVATNYKRCLIFPGLSKIGFFYIRGMFHAESETRLLINRDMAYQRGLTIKANTAGYEYLELPFHSPIATIALTKVFMGEYCDEKKVRSLLASKPEHSAVKILPWPH